MPPIIANDIGGLGQMIMADRQQRDALSAAAMSRLMQEQARQQQQRQFEASQQMERARMDQAMRENALSRALQTRRLDEYEIPSLELRRDTTKTREEQIREADALALLLENRMPYDRNKFKNLPPEIIDPLIQWDEMQRKTEAENLKKAEEIAEAGNRLLQFQKRTTELSKTPANTGWRFPFSRVGIPRQNPAQTAKDMQASIAPIQQRLAPLLAPKAGLVEQDVATGKYVPSRQLRLPWMTQTNQVPALEATSGTAAAKPTKVLDANSAMELLRRTGGDKAAARKLAVEMGFQIPQVQ